MVQYQYEVEIINGETDIGCYARINIVLEASDIVDAASRAKRLMKDDDLNVVVKVRDTGRASMR